MNNPGTYNLGDKAITSAVTDVVITSAPDGQGVNQGYVAGLDGMLAATISASFNAGNGAGTSCKVDVFTSLDQGLTWIPVARIAFGNTSAQKVCNLSGLTPKATPAAAATLSDDACLDGVFGDRWKAQITTVGTFGSNASISVRLNAR